MKWLVEKEPNVWNVKGWCGLVELLNYYIHLPFSIIHSSIHGIGCKLVALLKYCSSDYKSGVSLSLCHTFCFSNYYFPLFSLEAQSSTLPTAEILFSKALFFCILMNEMFSSTFAKSIVSTCVRLFRMPLWSSFSSSDTSDRSASPWISVLVPALCSLQKTEWLS